MSTKADYVQGHPMTDTTQALRDALELADSYAGAWAKVEAWTDADDAPCPSADTERSALSEYLRAALAASPQPAQEPASSEWRTDGEAAVYVVAAWLCEREGDDPHQLLWEGGPVPEPWGDRWMKYEPDAKALLKLLQAADAAPQPAPAVPQLTEDMLRYAMSAVGTGSPRQADEFRRFWRFASEAHRTAPPKPLPSVAPDLGP